MPPFAFERSALSTPTPHPTTRQRVIINFQAIVADEGGADDMQTTLTDLRPRLDFAQGVFNSGLICPPPGNG